MALSATIYKADLGVADIDRGYYGQHNLTIACHPSETTARMMLRVLAFACHADPDLKFGRGVSADDEPDLWLVQPDGRISLWVELGQPDERDLRKASARADQVWLYTYGGRSVDPWWKKMQSAAAKLDNLTIVNIPSETMAALDGLTARTMKLDCTILEGSIQLSDGQQQLELKPEFLQRSN
ncbi:YaeQ family protein [Parachitinimonas caeni]|uniref:YaeQ family protein n=1 Tax=Parachitinimonas caeni TaxID=3031301 RepID=A0ABT7DSG7_9NEIS|nr:YaeQ family protein [Parachitinimonas caeni]MDK2123015.1 YaeQ family protein [Parachitinimonas caeni]